MTKPAPGQGQAFDASVATSDGTEPAQQPAEKRSRDQRTDKEQEYLDAIAEADEAAVEGIEQQIKDLQASLKDRKSEAKQSRAAAKGKGE